MRNEENICQYYTRQRAIITLSLNACLNKMYQESSYLLIVSGLLNLIWCYIGTNKQKEKLQVLTLPGYVLYFLTALHFHISTRIFYNLFICFVYDSLFCYRFLFKCFGPKNKSDFWHVSNKLSISLCWHILH